MLKSDEQIDPRHRYGHNLHYYYDCWLRCESKEPFFYWSASFSHLNIDISVSSSGCFFKHRNLTFLWFQAGRWRRQGNQSRAVSAVEASKPVHQVPWSGKPTTENYLEIISRENARWKRERKKSENNDPSCICAERKRRV